jgi:hypothetical protein
VCSQVADRKCAVVRHDQARFVEVAEEMFEQDLRAEIEEVGGFVVATTSWVRGATGQPA